MFIRAIRSQIIFLLRQKETAMVFYILLIMIMINYLVNVSEFQGRDVTRMYQPMKLLLLSYNRVNYKADATLLLIQLYPVLTVCPAGFSLIREHHSGQGVLMAARLGYPVYLLSKIMAAFMATALVFFVPFFLELLLNSFSFPLEAMGDLTNWGAYDSDYIQSVNNYLMRNIYQYSPYLYALAGTLFFAFVSGLFGAFTVAFSAIVRVKYRIFMFLPVFLLLNATIYLVEMLPKFPITIKWYDYLLFFNDEKKSPIFIVVGLLFLVLFSVSSAILGSKKGIVR